MSYKHGNWYCKPANKAEAIEIIERAVVSGAKFYEFVEHIGEIHDNGYGWNMYPHWGVYNGHTHTSDAAAFDEITLYTIKQVRELFPMPGIGAVTMQGKSVGFCEDTALALAERTFSTEIDEQLASDIIQYANRLYNHFHVNQQPTPDVAALVKALKQIERWEGFPSTNETWEGSGKPVSYSAAFGSNGERDFMRGVAKAALAAYRDQKVNIMKVKGDL